MNCDQIKRILDESSPLPHVLDRATVNYVWESVPSTLRSGRRHLVDVNDGFLHGLSTDTIDQIGKDAEMLSQAKMIMTVLLLALENAAGSQEQTDFLIAHAYKKVQQDCGILPKEPPVLRKD
jgi:hypothetical protein